MRADLPGGGADRTIAVKHDFPLAVKAGVIGTFLLLFIGALYYARGFVLPLVMACLLTLTLSPVVSRLSRLGVPAVISALLLVGAVGGAVGAASIFFSGSISQMATEMPDTIQTVRHRLEFLKRPIATLNKAGADIEGIFSGSEGAAGTPKVVVATSGGGFVAWLLGTVADFGSTVRRDAGPGRSSCSPRWMVFAAS